MVYSLLSDHAVTNEEKEKIAKRICLMPQTDEFRRGRPVMKVDVNDKTTLSDLVGPDSWFIFDALSADRDWLRQPVSHWHLDKSFQKIHEFVNKVKVVNDATERGVKLNTVSYTHLTLPTTSRV